MKVASIVYPRQQRKLPNDSSYGFHFFLGQWCVNSIAYRTHLESQRAFGNFVIVDNGAAEAEEERVSFDAIVSAAFHYADEIVMPDVLKDKDATLNVLLEALNMYKIPPTQRMFVPQGSTWEEWEECLEVMMAYPFATIGVAKHLGDLPGGRYRALNHIFNKGYHHKKHVHLLGLYTSDPVMEVSKLSKMFPWVRSLDTGAPMAWAQARRRIDDRGIRCSLSSESDFDIDYYQYNVTMLRNRQ